MNAKKVIYHTSRGVLGTGFLITQLMADAFLEAEVAITSKTGKWDGNKQTSVKTDKQKDAVRDFRIQKTHQIRTDIRQTLNDRLSAFNAKVLEKQKQKQKASA